MRSDGDVFGLFSEFDDEYGLVDDTPDIAESHETALLE